MIDNYQIKGLEKLVNTGVIKDIYPMVDHIDISYNRELQHKVFNLGMLDVDIFLNDPTFNMSNMYMRDFDPHYLVEYHIKKYLPYFNIDKVIMNFQVKDLDGNVITSYKH
jgi:hypothetical protein